MPYARQTLTELKTQVAQDIASALPGSEALLRFSNLTILGMVQANLSHQHNGYIDWIARQAVPYTATDEFLEAWAGLKGVMRKAATLASGAVTFSGAAGTVLPAGTPLARGDGMAFFTTELGRVGSDGLVVVHASATSNPADPAGLSGANGNTDVGVGMALGQAIAGIQSNGTVSTAFTGGAEIETDDSLRTRMLAAFQAPAHGGAERDYIAWALEVSGVTRAWCLPNGMGAGTVVVYVMLDQAQAGHDGFPQGTDGVAGDEPRAIPATGDQLAVADFIFPLQPVTALVFAVAPIPQPIDFLISGLAASSPATRAQIAEAISGVFFLSGTPNVGVIALSLIESAIAAIPGTLGFVIVEPIGNITTTQGHLPVLGTVTYR